MAETRLQMAKRLLAETERDLELAIAKGLKVAVKSLISEVEERKAKVRKLEEESK